MISLLHYASLLLALLVSAWYFRDLGDITQMAFKVSRRNLLFAIRHEKHFLWAGAVLLAIAMITWRPAGAGVWSFVVVALCLIMLVFPWAWVHLGLRNQQQSARFYTVDQASQFVRPDTSVLVIENGSHARAHPDYELQRPHLAGTRDGLGGENILMTYCAMSHLGIAVKPERMGRLLSLDVAGQHGNNLVLRDRSNSEPFAQIDCCTVNGPLERWPTFRMRFDAFVKAYPQGEVFLNPIPGFLQNPLFFVVDHLVEALFRKALHNHHHREALMFDTMTHEDTRLPRKTLVWALEAGGESAAFTADFIKGAGYPLNIVLGGQRLVVGWQPEEDCITAFYRPGDRPVTELDFRGQSDRGKLQRFESLFPGLYWFVWVNFHPDTLLNEEVSLHDGVALPNANVTLTSRSHQSRLT